MRADGLSKQRLQSRPGSLPQIIYEAEQAGNVFGKGGLYCNQFLTGCADSFFSFNQNPNRPCTNSPKYHISELIDMSHFYQLLDSFYNITKIPYTILDNNNNILCGRGWQDICSHFHRVCPHTLERCLQSDSFISSHLQHGRPYVGYMCLNGLMDYASPIVVEDQYLAAIFFGQFFHEPPNLAFFRQQAQKYGFDESAYMEALGRVPIVPESEIAPIMAFYSQLGQILATMGLERLRQMESAHHAIQEHEKSYKMILEASTDGYLHWDIKADLIHISRQLAARLGCPPEVVVINSDALKAFIHPQDIACAMKNLNDHLAARTPNYSAEHRVMTKTGEERWFLVRGKVLARDAQDKPLRMAITCFDISERKRTEAALQLSEVKFSKAFNASPVTMGITTLENGRIIAVNDSFCRTLGYQREDIVGRTVAQIGLWKDECTRQLIIDLLKEKSSIRDKEIHFSNSTGEMRLGNYSAEKLEIDGLPCVLSILTDITEQRQIEADMLRMDRLNLVGEMAASIGHEIRNPMTSIRGFLQMFSEKYTEDQEFLSIMIGELDRANLIISEFLSLAKNKMVQLERLRLTSIILNIHPLLQANAAIQDKNVVLELNDVPYLLLDEKEVRQLLFNLVYNGLEAMNGGGTLTIKTLATEEHVVLSVHDQGQGIDDEVLDKLGTPFLTTKEKGTGLGLPICYGIAARHRARIDVETGSEGTNFMVYFPRLKEEPAEIIQPQLGF